MSILDTNARFLELDLTDYLDQAGKLVAKRLLADFGSDYSYAFVCGLGGNGGDALAAARHLALLCNTCKISVYLIGRASDILDPAAAAQWQNILQTSKTHPHLEVDQDCFATDIAKHDVIIEALSGTGFRGSVRKRFRDVVTRITHFNQIIVAMDVPFPGYTPDACYAIGYIKYPGSQVLNIDWPADLLTTIGPGEVQALVAPKLQSHKHKNGHLVVLGANDLNISDLVKHYAVSHTVLSLINIDSQLNTLTTADSVLIHPSWPINLAAKALLLYVLENYPPCKLVVTSEHLAWLSEMLKFLGNTELIIIGTNQSWPKELRSARSFVNESQNAVYFTGSYDSLWYFDNTLQAKTLKHLPLGLPEAQYQEAVATLAAAYATKNPTWLSVAAAGMVVRVSGVISKQVTSMSTDESWGKCNQY